MVGEIDRNCVHVPVDLASHVFFSWPRHGRDITYDDEQQIGVRRQTSWAAVMDTAGVYACECTGTPETVLAHNPPLLVAHC